jgi:hypothetical protein
MNGLPLGSFGLVRSQFRNQVDRSKQREDNTRGRGIGNTIILPDLSVMQKKVSAFSR